MHTHKHRAAGESEICKASGQAEHLGRVNATVLSVKAGNSGMVSILLFGDLFCF